MAKTPKTPPIGVRLEPDVRVKLEAIAEREGRSISNLIAAVCKRFIEDREKAEAEK